MGNGASIIPRYVPLNRELREIMALILGTGYANSVQKQIMELKSQALTTLISVSEDCCTAFASITAGICQTIFMNCDILVALFYVSVNIVLEAL